MDRKSYEAALKRNIQIHGFTLIGVFDPNNEHPSFVYSVGLTERGWPEVLLIGNMNPATAEVILTDLISSWFKQEKVVMGDNADMIQFADGSDHALRVINVPADEAIAIYGCQTVFFYPDRDIKFVQVLWPDMNGKYPDDTGYDHEMKQPIVGRG